MKNYQHSIKVFNNQPVIKDKNNIESGIKLPIEDRLYVDKDKYVNKHSSIGLTLNYGKILLST